MLGVNVLLRKIKLILEFFTNTQIKVRRALKIKVHPDAVSNGQSMILYGDLVKSICNFNPQNIFEIGANYAQDAESLRNIFSLKSSDVYVFEPHPQIFKGIKSLYDFNSYELAISNENGRAKFHAIDVENNEYKNSGISSLKQGLKTNSKNFIDVDVEMVRMDAFIQKNNITNIDFLKVDVEGVNYEVFEGFGEDLSKVKVIQTEGEYKAYWEGQKLFHDLETLLLDHGFVLAHFLLSGDGIQSDSLWVQEKYIKRREG